MIQTKCIQKFRDKNNHIYGYRLQDINGKTQDVEPNNLKQAITNKQIHVVNLTLTSDGRLVDTNEKQLKSKELGEAPQRQHISRFEAKCRDIITYISKEAHIEFNKNTYDYKSNDKENEKIIIFSKEFTKINAKLRLSITNETSCSIGIDILSDNISYLIKYYDSNGVDKSSVDDTVKSIIKFKLLFENINNASSLLKAANILVGCSDEAPEVDIESTIISLENVYGINTHDEIQRRINVITSNKNEMDRIKRLVNNSGEELQFEYDVDINNEGVVESYIRASIYHEALFSDKVSDIFSVHILKYEAKNDFDFEYKI